MYLYSAPYHLGWTGARPSDGSLTLVGAGCGLGSLFWHVARTSVEHVIFFMWLLEFLITVAEFQGKTSQERERAR